MHFTQICAAVAASAMLATAAPAGTQEGSVDVQQTTIQRQSTGNMILRNGPRAHQKAVRKYNMTTPVRMAVIKAATPGQTGTVSASPQVYDEEYLSPVQIGTPAQTLMLDFDTGSSDFWVFSGELNAQTKKGHAVYTISKSTTHKKLAGETWDISYGDGSGASGNVFADKVVIGGVTVTSQGVEAATSVSASFASDTNTDGLVGLAGPKINTVRPDKQGTFFSNARPSLAQAVFAAYLKPGTAGAYDFGYLNSAHYTGTVHYAAADRSQGFWGFTPSAFAVGATSVSNTGSYIVDTGTSLIFALYDAYQDYWGSVPGAQYSNQYGGVVFPCSTTLPSFSVTVAGSQRTVPGSYINYAPVSSTMCFGGIQYAGSMSFGILGDVFIKSQYVVFDAQNTQIGFADQA